MDLSRIKVKHLIFLPVFAFISIYFEINLIFLPEISLEEECEILGRRFLEKNKILPEFWRRHRDPYSQFVGSMQSHRNYKNGTFLGQENDITLVSQCSGILDIPLEFP